MRLQHYVSILGLAGVVAGMACGGGGGPTPPPPPPSISSISPLTVSPGDTLTIKGSNFSTVASENTVTFTNPSSNTKPVRAKASELKVVVDRDAVDGPVKVSNAGGSATSKDQITVPRGIGDVFVFGGTGSGHPLSLPNPTSTTRYLVVPHSVSSTVSYLDTLDYVVSSASNPPAAMAAKTAAAPGLHMGAEEWFEAQRWENAQRDLQRYGVPAAGPVKRPGIETAAPAATRQFYVLKTTDPNFQNSASGYAHITAQLRYNGSKCLVYSDIDTLPTGNFTQAHYDLFGQTYDNSIEATNVSYFGPYSDVDGNGKLIMLVSPVVNLLQEPPCPGGTKCTCGFIAGFFNPRDLYGSPPVPAGTTNHAEIIYLLAADPNGVWDCQFPVDATASENLSTIPHEHQHLISFSWRIFHEGGATQYTWLEEGMAHMAEDLNGDNSSNIARGKLFRAAPGAVSIENNSAPLAQRGEIYLMLRLLADRYGTGILKQILQSTCQGRKCIENVTGMNFYDVYAEFLAALYLSGKGITSDDRFNYQSINIDDFGTLQTALHAAGGSDVTGTIHRTSGQFHIFTGTLNQESVFTFTDVSGSAKLRDVIVRIQ